MNLEIRSCKVGEMSLRLIMPPSIRAPSARQGRKIMVTAKTGSVRDEEEIRKLKETFASAFLRKNAKLRASIWTDDGTVVPPQGGFYTGREAMEKHFETEAASVTNSSKMSFSNYRFRFITADAAFVDADITLNDVLGPDGKLHAVLPLGLVFTAVRQGGAWFVQDERAYFK